MLPIKIRIAQGLKVFGLHPVSELRELTQQHNRDHAWLQQRNEQLQKRVEQMQQCNEQLQQRNEQLQQRNEQLQKRVEQLRTESASAGARRKFKHVEDEPVWHRRAVGGRWDEIGQLQLGFLREHGLGPQHYLLDVGCGSLRGGVRFIPFLEAGHYYGVDIDERMLKAGRTELEAANLQDRRPNLMQMDDFGFERLGQKFDFALANSVFTHLPLNAVGRCLVNMDRVLSPGGAFYATYFETPGDRLCLDPVEQGDGVISFHDKDPYHYTRDAMEWACKGTGLTANYVGDWGHPRHQVMMEFRKEGPTQEGTDG